MNESPRRDDKWVMCMMVVGSADHHVQSDRWMMRAVESIHHIAGTVIMRAEYGYGVWMGDALWPMAFASKAQCGT